MSSEEQVFFGLSGRQWRDLHDISVRQRISGQVFHALSLSYDSRGLPESAAWNKSHGADTLPEELFYYWLSHVALIQDTNPTHRQLCKDFLDELSEEGIDACILKGQGIDLFYPDEIALFREPGDIDMWVDASPNEVVEYAKRFAAARENATLKQASYSHVAVIVNGLGVEFHYRPTYRCNAFYNRRLQHFAQESKPDWRTVDGLRIPSWEFSAVQMLSHMNCHFLGSGVNLRQMFDYCCLLKSRPSEAAAVRVAGILKRTGLCSFAASVMWVMRDFFSVDESMLICEPDIRRGKVLLDEILNRGPYGAKEVGRKICRNLRMLRYYPADVLVDPFWRLTGKRHLK